MTHFTWPLLEADCEQFPNVERSVTAKRKPRYPTDSFNAEIERNLVLSQCSHRHKYTYSFTMAE